VRRERSAADGRVTLVQLTQAGRDLQEPVEEIWRVLETRWAHLDPADAEQLTSLARSMRTRAD
jgi:DNA-binding MarR family transcriptional regulator